MRGTAKAMPASSASRGSGGSNGGAPIIIVGIVLLAFWLLCFITQITTNEAWIQGQATVNVYQPNFGIFLQPILLFFGHIGPVTLDGVSVPAVIFGWGIEVLFVAFSIVGFEMIHHSVHQAGVVLGYGFEILALIAIYINWQTDYNYGTLGSGPWGHAIFATMNAFVVGYFFNLGYSLVRKGWSRV